jgi:hypothetical protein
VNDEELRARLEQVPLPDQVEAEERAWELVRSTYRNELEARAVEGSRPGKEAGRWPLIGRPASRVWVLVAVLAIGVVVSPARALVTDLVKDVVQGPKVESTTVSTSPPGGGRLLVQSRAGAWVTNDDGSRRHLGDFEDSTWSPQGRFIAATDDRQLVALAPDGEVRWALTRPSRPSLPSWNSPDGFRIAYIEGRQLRIVAGDGTGDTMLAFGVDAVRPSWRPGSAHELAFVRDEGRVEALSADSGRRLFSWAATGQVRGIEWSDDGSRLLVWTRRSAVVLDSDGHTLWRHSSRPGSDIESAYLRPRSSQMVVVEDGGQARVVLAGPRRPARVVLAAQSLADPVWSADGSELMVAWPDADQWLFLRGRDLRRATALGDISRQFSPGARGGSTFPTVTGWCCSER